MDSKQNFRPKSISVINQLSLLKEVISNPEQIDNSSLDELINALQSQGSLAAFELSERGIISMSLNTQKTIADKEVDGGYAVFNEYRKAALEKLNQQKKNIDSPNRGTLEWYRTELSDKTAQLERQVNEVAMMALKLEAILGVAAQMAVAAGKEAEFNKYRNEILRKFPA